MSQLFHQIFWISFPEQFKSKKVVVWNWPFLLEKQTQDWKGSLSLRPQSGKKPQRFSNKPPKINILKLNLILFNYSTWYNLTQLNFRYYYYYYYIHHFLIIIMFSYYYNFLAIISFYYYFFLVIVMTIY